MWPESAAILDAGGDENDGFVAGAFFFTYKMGVFRGGILIEFWRVRSF
jgi:hypothetical protein